MRIMMNGEQYLPKVMNVNCACMSKDRNFLVVCSDKEKLLFATGSDTFTILKNLLKEEQANLYRYQVLKPCLTGCSYNKDTDEDEVGHVELTRDGIVETFGVLSATSSRLWELKIKVFGDERVAFIANDVYSKEHANALNGGKTIDLSDYQITWEE